MKKLLLLSTAFICFGLPAFAQDGAVPASAEMTQQISELQSKWAVIKYQTPDKAAQEKAIATLEEEAAKVTAAYPSRAEPKIWEGIILATDGGIEKNISALPKVKKARTLLEQAIAIDETSLGGSAHASLGSLYYQVPSWPIAFGDNKEAKNHLLAALKINPDSIDNNYFYADFLIHQDKFAEAVPVLEKALKAAPRPGRESADVGRRQDIQKDLDLAHEKMADNKTDSHKMKFN